MHVCIKKNYSFSKKVIYFMVALTLILGSINISKFDVLAAGVPTALPATNVAYDSFTANWTSVAGTTNYYLDVATDSNFTVKITGYDNKDMGTSTICALTGLASVTNYFYRVKVGGTYSNIVYVQTPAKDGAYSSSVSTASGSEYSISTPEQLKALADTVNSGTSYDGVQFKLADNIDLAAYKADSNGLGTAAGTGWMPIGVNAYGKPFQGKFDGNGYVVKNMLINRINMVGVGLFGFFNGSTGEIKNVGVVDCDVTGGTRVGAIVGWAYDSGSGNVVISECFSSGSVEGQTYVAGIVGEAETKVFTVKNCYSSASIKGTATGRNAFGYGGIVGYVYGPAKSTSIINCYSTGAVEGPNFVGGIIGGIEVRNTTINPATTVYIKNCVALNKSITSTYSGASAENTDGILTESSSTATTTSLQNRVVGGIWENTFDGPVDKTKYTVSYTDLYGLGTISVKWKTNTGVSAKTQSTISPDGASITETDLTDNAKNWTDGPINDVTGTIAAGAVTYFDYTEAGGANSVWYYYQNKQVLPVLTRYMDNYQQVLVTPASLSATVPYATDVYANSTNQLLSLGNILTASYTYNANGAGAESGSTFKWYRYDTDKGGVATQISGASTTSYTLTSADTGKYISFEVTPSDGAKTGSAVESERVGPIIDTANADLINLTLSDGTLSPDFAAGTTAYSASVANPVSSITVTPTVSDANATVKVNGTNVTSGQASGNINLNVGSNTITVVVTAQDTTTKTYTITVTRMALSSNADASPAPAPTTVRGDVVENITGQSVKGVEVQVTVGANGTKTVAVKSEEAILIKQPDGTQTPLSDISRLVFSAADSNSNITLSADGTIQVKNLVSGTESKFAVAFDLGNGQKIIIGTIDVKVGSNGDVSFTSTLIDPYGIITDSATGKAIVGANVTLYYANTEGNKSTGKTPGTAVPLPLIDGFKPNNNINPQLSDASGAYAFMVFPNSDYYIVAEKNGYNKYTSPILSVEKELVKWDFKMQETGAERLFGQDRVDTALEIAKTMFANNIPNVILATAENYPDALAGSVLAYKLNAPILLVGSTEENQQKVLSYLKDYMNPAGTVYILGGTGAVSTDMETKINGAGFKNINRLGGADRYETSVKIAEELGVNPGTPIVLVSGENYPDALSVSSPAAIKQYPILLVEKNGISDSVRDEILKINPCKVYLIGLQGAIDTAVENEVAKSISIDKANIVRIGGADRFETSLETAKYFDLSGDIVCVATGNDFPDALAGSIYAAKNNAPIILADKKLSDNQMIYLENMKMSGATIFGGEGAVSKDIKEQLSQLLGQ